MKRKIKVSGSALIDLLSRTIYTDLHTAIREVISNSYDAGADNVKITLESGLEHLNQTPAEDISILFADDGKGMGQEEFWDGYLNVGSLKKNYDEITKRYSIGKFGIGALAMFPFTIEIMLMSKTLDGEYFSVIIPTKLISELYKKHSDNDKVFSEEDDLSEIFLKFITAKSSKKKVDDEHTEVIKPEEIESIELALKELSFTHGTVIQCRGVTADTKYLLINGDPEVTIKHEALEKNGFLTNGEKYLAWQLSTICPLVYENTPEYSSNQPALTSCNPGINLFVNEIKLNRQIYSNSPYKIKNIEYNKDGVKATGVIFCCTSVVKPMQARGVILRVRNVAVGPYSHLGCGGQLPSLALITGEIHIEGLDDTMKGDRSGFLETKFAPLRNKLVDDIRKAANTGMLAQEEQKQLEKAKLDKLKKEIIDKELKNNENNENEEDEEIKIKPVVFESEDEEEKDKEEKDKEEKDEEEKDKEEKDKEEKDEEEKDEEEKDEEEKDEEEKDKEEKDEQEKDDKDLIVTISGDRIKINTDHKIFSSRHLLNGVRKVEAFKDTMEAVRYSNMYDEESLSSFNAVLKKLDEAHIEANKAK